MSYTLMIVDDDREFLVELRKLLAAPDIEIFTHSDSVEALTAIKTIRPDLVLLDVKMEGLTGIQIAALARLSKEIRDIPIIMISGNVDRKEIRNAMDLCNIKRYFEKPVDPEELIAEIRGILPAS